MVRTTCEDKTVSLEQDAGVFHLLSAARQEFHVPRDALLEQQRRHSGTNSTCRNTSKRVMRAQCVDPLPEATPGHSALIIVCVKYFGTLTRLWGPNSIEEETREEMNKRQKNWIEGNKSSFCQTFQSAHRRQLSAETTGSSPDDWQTVEPVFLESEKERKGRGAEQFAEVFRPSSPERRRAGEEVSPRGSAFQPWH